ncbi:MAG: hypothetical protein ACYTFY_16520 [Planctomycetota bacterium]|jgi:hypothetical protein
MKKILRRIVCLTVIASFCVTLLMGSLHASSTLNVNQKIQVVNIAANAAANTVKTKKDFPLAKLLLYGAVEPAFRIIPASAGNPKVGQTINSFATASMMTWPGAPQQPDVQKVAAFLKKYNANKAKITRLAMDFNIFNVPSGKAAYRRKVADIKARGDQVSKEMGEFLSDAPPVTHFLTSPPLLQQALPIFSQFFNIVFGQIFVDEHVKKIGPELVDEMNKAVATAKAGKSVSNIGLQIGDAERKLKLLKTIDSKSAEIKKIEAGLAEAQKHLNKVYEAQVASNRFPKDVWKGSAADHKKLLGEMEAIFKKLTKDKIVKIHITSEAFVEGWEGWWDDKDVWHAAYIGDIRAAAVVDHNGDYRVLGQSFYRTLNVAGSALKWTPLKKWKILYNFRILKENIDK